MFAVYVLDHWFQRDGKLVNASFHRNTRKGIKAQHPLHLHLLRLLLLFLTCRDLLQDPHNSFAKTMGKHWPYLRSQSLPQGSVMGPGWGSRWHLWSETASWSDSLVQMGFRFRSPKQQEKLERVSYSIYYLDQGLANISCKGLDSKYFCRPYDLFGNYSTLPWQGKSSCS